MQLLRIALRLTMKDIVRSLKLKMGSLVLELRVAQAEVNLKDAKSSLCSQCGMAVLLVHESDTLMCSKLSATATLNRPTHVLVQRQSKARSINTKLTIGLVFNYALKVVYDDSANEWEADLSYRALTYRVGDDWVTSTPSVLDLLKRGGMRNGHRLGHEDEQSCPERWAVFLPPDHVQRRLNSISSEDTRYPWYQDHWVDLYRD